jgi:hypothetical protein
VKDSQSEISRISRREGDIKENGKRLNERSLQAMRAVYLVLFVALILALGTLEVIAERSVSAAYLESESSAYPESGTSVYFK